MGTVGLSRMHATRNKYILLFTLLLVVGYVQYRYVDASQGFA
jgi:hypothetical protein